MYYSAIQLSILAILVTFLIISASYQQQVPTRETDAIYSTRAREETQTNSSHDVIHNSSRNNGAENNLEQLRSIVSCSYAYTVLSLSFTFLSR